MEGRGEGGGMTFHRAPMFKGWWHAPQGKFDKNIRSAITQRGQRSLKWKNLNLDISDLRVDFYSAATKSYDFVM